MSHHPPGDLSKVHQTPGMCSFSSPFCPEAECFAGVGGRKVTRVPFCTVNLYESRKGRTRSTITPGPSGTLLSGDNRLRVVLHRVVLGKDGHVLLVPVETLKHRL
jgi:hypothetical protein